MPLLPAPNRKIAFRVWRAMIRQGCEPCGGFFVRVEDESVRDYLVTHRGIEGIEDLLSNFGGEKCAVFVTMSLHHFLYHYARRPNHLFWKLFGGQYNMPALPTSQPITLDECILAVGESYITPNLQRAVAQFDIGQMGDWNSEEPWSVVRWFGIEGHLVPHVKVISSAKSDEGAYCSFPSTPTWEQVRDTLRDFVTGPNFAAIVKQERPSGDPPQSA